jgi:hypothetical protein
MERTINAVRVRETDHMAVFQEVKPQGEKYGTLGQFYVNKGFAGDEIQIQVVLRTGDHITKG